MLADTPEGIARAAALLRAGRLVAFATETVYGLGADATDAVAVDAIYAAKGRPRRNPLICHYATGDAAFVDGMADARARALADAFWPGPLTLVLRRAPASRIVVTKAADNGTVAVRVPAHPTARALLATVGRPVAAPSANRSGRVSPTRAAHVAAELDGSIDAILDSGPCAVGVESTVLDLSGERAVLLRPGGLAADALGGVLGEVPVVAQADETGPLRAPGLLGSHYAPRARVRLGATEVSRDEALLAFGPPPAGASALFQLSERRDLAEAAARLYAGLRALDGQAPVIAVMSIPNEGLGIAINDRLRRASAARV